MIYLRPLYSLNLANKNYVFSFCFTLAIPMCLTNTYKVQNISQNPKVYYIKYNIRATCFDYFESSSDPQVTDPR